MTIGPFAGLCLLAVALAAAQEKPVNVRLELAPLVARADERVTLRVRGLRPRQPVIVRAEAQDLEKRTWHSFAGFHADARGEVDLATAAPLQGTYRGADVMGLIHSLDVGGQAHQRTRFEHRRWDPWTITFSLEVDGRSVARVEHRRTFGEAIGATDVRSEGMVGTLFRPAGAAPAPAVVILSGSEGGLAGEDIAALLAARGYVALALAYFGAEGLPQELAEIPLEYFLDAIRWLKRQSGVDASRLALLGTSKGAEAALLAGGLSPDLRAVVAYAPSSVVWSCICGRPTSSWTFEGKPLPFVPAGSDPTYRPPPGFPIRPAVNYRHRLAGAKLDEVAIPVERVRARTLLIAGEDDQLWPSADMAAMLAARANQRGRAAAVTVLRYPRAGHLIGKYYSPTSSTLVGGGRLETGGTPGGNAAAQADAWPRVLRFLESAFRR